MVHCNEATGEGLRNWWRARSRVDSAERQAGGLLLEEALVGRVDGRLHWRIGCDEIVRRLRIGRIRIKAAARSAASDAARTHLRSPHATNGAMTRIEPTSSLRRALPSASGSFAAS